MSGLILFAPSDNKELEDDSSLLAHLMQEVIDIGLGVSEMVTQGYVTLGHEAVNLSQHLKHYYKIGFQRWTF